MPTVDEILSAAKQEDPTLWTEKPKLTIAQIDKMKHAMGGKIKYGAYRNRYFAAPIDQPDWEYLVEVGFAERWHDKPDGTLNAWYSVTDKAIDALEDK